MSFNERYGYVGSFPVPPPMAVPGGIPPSFPAHVTSISAPSVVLMPDIGTYKDSSKTTSDSNNRYSWSRPTVPSTSGQHSNNGQPRGSANSNGRSSPSGPVLPSGVPVPFLTRPEKAKEPRAGELSIFEKMVMKKKGTTNSVAVVDLEIESEHGVEDTIECDEMEISVLNVKQASIKRKPPSPKRRSIMSVRDRRSVLSVGDETLNDDTELVCISDTELNEEADIAKALKASLADNIASPSLANQQEDDIIMLSSDEEENDDDVIVMEDLTLLDEIEGSPFSTPKSVTTPRRSQWSAPKIKESRTSLDAPFVATCVNALEDSLSRGTVQVHKISPRFWQAVQNPDIPGLPKKSEFRICSYNVLCQETIKRTSYLYGHLGEDQSALEWEHRWHLLESDLMMLDADIYGLQEVQYDHFISHYTPFMEKLGFVGFYKRRTGGVLPDGCALFYRTSRFKAKNYNIVEYFVAAKTVMDREQVGQILRLECNHTGQNIIVGNTHLLFNPNRGDIKIGQLAMLSAHIKQELLTGGDCPVIITGDFNMEPHSYVYNYISESEVFLRGLPRNELSGQGSLGGPAAIAGEILPKQCKVGRDGMFTGGEPRSPPKADYFTHPLNLTSVYSHINPNSLKEISTYHREAANPDFIFYSIRSRVRTANNHVRVYESHNLRLLRRLTLPDLPLLKSTLGPWPNKHVPSDHIPLVADFCLGLKQQ